MLRIAARYASAAFLLAFGLNVAALAAGSVAKVALVSGDRQILQDSDTTSPAPYVVRAIDAAGAPVAGVGIVVLEATYSTAPGITVRDEFGFLGFGQLGAGYFPDGPPAANQALSDGNGLVAVTPRLPFVAPAAFLVAATHYGPGGAFAPALFSVVRISTLPPGNPVVVVEYFNSSFGHYFNTALQVEMDALDNNAFPGWRRSVGSYIAYATARDAPASAVPVCRFFSSTYTAHFYTASVAECDAVVAKWPDVWVLETRAAFYIQVPDPVSGACGAGLQPVYRLYSTRNGPNHRYVTDPNLRDAMVRAGWVAEGYGPDAASFCTAK